jgi:hypothetical protein
MPAQSLPQANWVILNLNASEGSEGDLLGNSLYQVPDNGTYLVTGCIGLATSVVTAAQAEVVVRLTVNGNHEINMGYARPNLQSGFGFVSVPFSAVIRLQQGANVTVGVAQFRTPEGPTLTRPGRENTWWTLQQLTSG